MFALPGLLALILVDYVRPQEYFQALAGIPLLHLSAGLALFGFVLDLRLGLSRADRAPHLLLTIALFAWSLVTVALRVPDQLGSRALFLAIPLAVYLFSAHGVQGFRMLQVVAGVLLALALFLSVIGIEQGLAPWGCHRVSLYRGGASYQFDGRWCPEQVRTQCEGEDAEPGATYACEHVGLLGTSSIVGRVRYRGTLEDPNELALVMGIAMPFAFAFLDRRRSPLRVALVAITVVGVGVCTLLTGSRGGQLVFLSVLAVYFIQRVGWRMGVAAGLVLALPVLLFGGRSGSESVASTEERLECWWAGLHMLVGQPLLGVGSGQFTDHHYMTAHNTFILIAGELGLVGALLFASVVYLAIKIPVQALRSDPPPVARSWATALLASIIGLVVGSFFLSYSYKDVFWLYVGLTGVLYHAMRRHDPAFEVGFGVRDLAAVGAASAVLFTSLIGYTWKHLGW